MILAAAWAAFLIPPLIRRARSGQLGSRRRTQWRMNAPMRSMHPRLAERGAVAAPVVALRPNIGISPPVYASEMASAPMRGRSLASIDARRRRRRILVTLIFSALATFVLAVYFNGIALVVHLLVDALLLAYALLLVQHQRTREERLSPVDVNGSTNEPWSAASGEHR